MPAVGVWGGCLSGCEPDVLVDHQAGLFRAFADEYAKHGGPSVDADELLLMYRLSVPNQIVAFIRCARLRDSKTRPSPVRCG